MNTIHVWPRYIKEFLLTHLGCNSPPTLAPNPSSHYYPQRLASPIARGGKLSSVQIKR